MNNEKSAQLVEEGIGAGKAGRFEQVLQLYEQSLAVNPYNTYAWFNKGVTHMKMDRVQEALKDFEKALSLDPSDADIWANKGTAYDRLELYRDAARAYEKALDLNPRHQVALFNKGSVHLALNEPRDAIICFHKIVEADPSDHQAQVLLCLALVRSNRKSEARRVLMQALEVTPNKEEIVQLMTVNGLGELLEFPPDKKDDTQPKTWAVHDIIEENRAGIENACTNEIQVPDIRSREDLVRFINTIVVKCPRCKQVGNLLYTETMLTMMSRADFGVATPCRCMHCGVGVLISINSGRIVHVIPFDSSEQYMEAMMEIMK